MQRTVVASHRVSVAPRPVRFGALAPAVERRSHVRKVDVTVHFDDLTEVPRLDFP